MRNLRQAHCGQGRDSAQGSEGGVCAYPELFHGVGYFRTRIPVVSGHEFIHKVVELGKEKFGVD